MSDTPSGYDSEFTCFIDKFIEQSPEVAESRRRGRYILDAGDLRHFATGLVFPVPLLEESAFGILVFPTFELTENGVRIRRCL